MEERKNMNCIKTSLLVLVLTLTTVLAAQDLSGTYTGIMKAETPDGTRDAPGTIVLKQDGERLLVTGGPSTEEQYSATKVERDGDSLKFEIAPPGDSAKRLQFEVTVKDGKIAGKVKSTSGGETLIGKLEFTRQ
jgi:hypothetical protein